jgi:hypothetical protein
MDEELRFVFSVESEGADAAAQKTNSAMQQVGQGFARVQTGLQDSAKTIQQTMGNITSAVRSTAQQLQNQYNGMSLDRLHSEFNKIEDRILKQQAVLQQAEQALTEYADIWEQVASSGARMAGTADGDPQLQALKQDAEAARQALQELQTQQQQVADAAVNASMNTQQMEQSRQQLAQNKMGVDALAFSLATVGRASGGAVEQVAALAMQVRYLKQGFSSTAQTAGTMAATISTALGAVGIAIMAVTMITGAISKAAEESKRKMAELREETERLRSDNVGASALVAEYEALSRKTVKTADDTQRMLDIRSELVDTYGYSAAAVDEEGRLLAGNLELMKEQLKVSRELFMAKLQENQTAEEKAYNDALKEREKQLEKIQELQTAIMLEPLRRNSAFQIISDKEAEEAIKKLESNKELIENSLRFLPDAAKGAIKNMFQLMVLEAQAEGKQVPEAIQEAVSSAWEQAFMNGISPEDARDMAQEMFNAFFSIDESVADSAIAIVQNTRNQLIAAFASRDGVDTEAATAAINSILADIFGEGAEQEIYARAEQLKQRIWDGLASPAELAEYDTLIAQIGSSLQRALDSANSRDAVNAIQALKNETVVTSKELRRMAAEQNALGKTLKDAASELRSVASAYESVSKAIKEVANIKGAKKAIEDYNNAIVKNKELSNQAAKAKEYLAGIYGVEKDAIEGMLPSIEDDIAMKEALALADYATAMAAAAAAQGQIQAMIAMNTVTQDQGAKMIDALQRVINKMAELGSTSISVAGTTIKPSFSAGSGGRSGGGGGGGGSRKNKALDREMALLDHKRALDQLTTAEEIANLERILAKYAKTTEEKRKLTEELYALRKQKAQEDLEFRKAMDQLTLREEIAAVDAQIRTLKAGTQARRELESERYQLQRELERQEFDLKVHYGQLTLEQQEAQIKKMIATYKTGVQARIELEKELYNVQQEIRARDIDTLNRVLDGVITALGARYEAQRQAEAERLDASKEAWREWGDAQVKAIQEQIAALDDMTKEEDRAEEERKKRRKIAALEQQLQYEQDAYNRKKLTEQLAAAQDDLSKWLLRNEREDLKEALRDKMDAVKDTVDAETDRIDAELKANDEYYDELTRQAALQAEAQKLLMQGTQDDILQLLKSYASDYNLTGQSLGEQLVDGFKSSVADIEAWFAGLTANFTAYQKQLASVATAAADQFLYRLPTPVSARVGLAQQGTAAAGGISLGDIYFLRETASPSEEYRELERMLERISQM